jgi:hypothetical protein
LIFDGTTLQEITGSQSTTFYCAVEVSNPAGIALTATAAPGASQVVDSSLILTDGKVKLNTFDLTISNEGITGAGAAKYIETNSTGSLINTVAAGGAAIAYPVGDSVYNPITIQNGGTGTTDSYGVRSKRGFPANWNPADHAVQGHWILTEGTTGGSNLTLTPTWKNTQHQTNFQTSDCAVGLSKNNGTTITWAASGAATDNTPFFSKAGSTFDTVGVVTVGDYYFEGIEIDLDVFLAGPYSSGSMSTALNSLLPDDDPYGNGVNNATIPGTAVDWIEIELRDETTPATIEASYSFFLASDGSVLNLTGTSGIKLTGVVKDQYYIAVRHRNHLGAMTASTIDFTGVGPFSFDFTAGTGLYGSNAMRNMGGTPAKWALWGGDADQNGVIEYARATTDITPISSAILTDPGNPAGNTNYPVNNVYEEADTDMNGIIEYARATTDLTPISSSVLSHPGNPAQNTNFPVNQQLP